MLTSDDQQLIDHIYEAGATPERWPAVMDLISNRIGGVGGMLFGARDHYRGTICTESSAGTFDRFVNEGWVAQDPTLPRANEMNYPGFINDQDMFAEEEIASHPVYGFFRREGIGFRAGSVIPNPSGDTVAMTFFRHQDDGPVPRSIVNYLDELRPHLARASMLSFRFGFEQARAQAQALQAIGLPGAVLRAGGRLLAANALFERLMPRVFQDRRTRIAVTDLAADALLVSAVGSPSAAHSVRSIPVASLGDHLPLILHLIPVRGTANDVFIQATLLLVVTPVDRARVPTAEVLQGLFDLTPAEARVARGIGEALSIADVATSQGVSRETVRSQIKAVLSKTGLGRQSELVSLLAGAGRVGPLFHPKG